MLILTPPFPFVPSEYRIKIATDPWELDSAAALRRAVFCEEQRIFAGDDQDDIDPVAIHIVAIACVVGMPDEVVGTVRIFEREPNVWQGARLAVHRDFRRVASLGTELIYHAVSTAHARGCRRFLATVQAQNAPLFRRLHWETIEEITLLGHPHHFMQADLAFYPPRVQNEVSFVTTLRNAA
jgi:putative N-acetyltransferase (TIGR04045 family)